MLLLVFHVFTLLAVMDMDVSGQWLQAAAAEGEAERVRAAAAEVRAVADEVASLLDAVVERLNPETWSGRSARLAEDQVAGMRESLHRAAGELDGVAWSMLLRASRLEETAAQVRAAAALASGGVLAGAQLSPPSGR